MQGVVLNMRGVALRCTGDLRRAAESYEAAIDICQEYEDMSNWAVAQANLGKMFFTMFDLQLQFCDLTMWFSIFMKGCCV